ncbi:MAG: MBL fold metallo-hydrolase [Alphaproteobacteria bacterium]|nr:MBL fold metallo-hydrolase [Alphaproteobacteria bacterium]
MFAKADYEHFAALQPGDRAYLPIQDSVRPIVEAGQAALVDNDFALDDEVVLHPTPGHTPGHYAVHLRSQRQRAMMTGDLMHHPIQVRRPDWSSFFCHDPVASRRTRERFMADHTDDDTLIFAAHFPGPTAGHIRQTRGERWFGVVES